MQNGVYSNKTKYEPPMYACSTSLASHGAHGGEPHRSSMEDFERRRELQQQQAPSLQQQQQQQAQLVQVSKGKRHFQMIKNKIFMQNFKFQRPQQSHQPWTIVPQRAVPPIPTKKPYMKPLPRLPTDIGWYFERHYYNRGKK